MFANLGLSKANFKLFYANQMVRILLINDIILWCGSSTRGFYLTIQAGIFMWEVLHKFSNLMSWILKLASLLSHSQSLIGRYLSQIQKFESVFSGRQKTKAWKFKNLRTFIFEMSFRKHPSFENPKNVYQFTGSLQ